MKIIQSRCTELDAQKYFALLGLLTAATFVALLEAADRWTLDLAAPALLAIGAQAWFVESRTAYGSGPFAQPFARVSGAAACWAACWVTAMAWLVARMWAVDGLGLELSVHVAGRALVVPLWVLAAPLWVFLQRVLAPLFRAVFWMTLGGSSFRAGCLVTAAAGIAVGTALVELRNVGLLG